MFLHLLKKLSKWFKTNWQDLFFTLVILLITTFIAFKNYTPGTYLTGWDNLHPEFNFKLNIERSLNAVWQEFQGVGLLGGMSHAADLPRQVIMASLSIIIPISFIRYFWTFLMLFVGPLGVYTLLKEKSKLGGFTASIFYIFNLATVQYFFVPFETFVGFFGFLPWLLYFAIEYLNNGKKLWKYAVISLMATTAFYVQTLFLVYGIFLLLLSFKNLRRSVNMFFVTLLINSFWLVPVLWFTLTSGSIPGKSDINRIASPETILMNQGRVDFTNIVNLKGYWFDYYDFNEGKFEYLFKPWIDYSSKPYIKEIGIGLFIASVVGLILSRQLIWVLLLGIGYLMLSGFKIPLEVLEEAFRNSFTKWSVAFSFVISIGLGYFVTKFKKLAIVPAIIIICASIYSVWPIVSGKLISERVKITIPHEYFETFNWFNAKTDSERVAYFPAFDKWGWNYHVWGYGGSGFIWYGIKNPILDRAFNVWSPNNENYYNEVTQAILNNDINLFKNILEKYQVKYLFLDDTVVFPWGERDLLKLNLTRQFAKDLGFVEVYNNNFISIYDTNFLVNDSVSALSNFTKINADLTYSKADPIYQKYGNYITDSKGLGLPFANFDTRSTVKIGISKEGLVISNKTANAKVVLPIAEKINEDFDPSHGYPETNNCDLMKLGSVTREQLDFGRKYRAENGGVACDYFVYDQLKYDSAYVLHIKGENKEGRSLKVYLYNWASKRVELEELLPTGKFDSYFVLYPKPQTLNPSSGYTLNIETRSFGRIASENIIEKIEFVPFDINLVQSLYSDPSTEHIVLSSNLKIINVQKFGTAIYKVETSGSGVIELGQGYEKGWVSYPKLEHVKVNSWSNGFVVPADHNSIITSRYLIFWPQFLEWGGFILLLLTIIYLIVKSKKLS